ncbi:MAG: hypothetical protein EA397_03215 [Deltaproteobacteria bacterium]|nr:MAG: hypothetical protein EA397_03215 [Deltaproteobacteria bacterium]
MMQQQLGGPADAGTVTVRVQVVDVEAAALDLVVPTYLPAKDVTQRIARDANLGAYWPDGTRRKFWLRARGRLLGEDERLQDLGVVSGELIHILPQPPDGSEVIERPPEYPRAKGYRGGNLAVMAGAALNTIGFTVLWALALTVEGGWIEAAILGLVPALAVALLATSTARHLFGPAGGWKIPVVALLFFFPLLAIAFVPAFLLGVEPMYLGASAGAGLLAGFGGVIMGFLSWFGAVEPLPERTTAEATALAVVEQSVAQCAICGGNVDLNDLDNRQDCVYSCGRVFHMGCYRARAAIAPEGQCAVCAYQPGA